MSGEDAKLLAEASSNLKRAEIMAYMTRHADSRKNRSDYCFRHDPEKPVSQSSLTHMQKLQKELEELSSEDRLMISRVWSIFSAAPSRHRKILLEGMLGRCCLQQLSSAQSMIQDLLRIDFLSAIPVELAFHILGYLDAKSLGRASMVSKRWQRLADDDSVWYHLCEQHIDRKCTKCGWGLPLLDRRRLRNSKAAMMRRLERISKNPSELDKTHNSNWHECAVSGKRQLEDGPDMPGSKVAVRTRPWKDVYVERFKIENNWRSGKHILKTFTHRSAVLCLQFDEQYLITGTYDGKVHIWDVETKELVRVMAGHFRAVSALKFDATKLVTGSWDQSVRVWNYYTGQCLSVFCGHDAKVLCIDTDHNLIAAGNADASIKVWDFKESSCFTLRGHTEPVHSVRIHHDSATLYTSSEDLTVRMWDLRRKSCIRVFGGPDNGPMAHVAQIQHALPITLEHLEGEEDYHSYPTTSYDSLKTEEEATECTDCASNADPLAEQRPTHLLTASLDNTIKLWDIRTGRCARTLFGHVEGVWCIAADNFRIVSGAHDKLVKVWDLQSGKCWHTFSGHTGPVCCVGLNDTAFASGGDDGFVKMYCFDVEGSSMAS